MKIHHVGYLTKSIDATYAAFQKLGYEMGVQKNDDVQQCRISLLTHYENGDVIELVEPYLDNIQMQKMLRKRGNSAYHICYEVEDVEAVYNEYCNKEGWINIFRPVHAVALGNRLITYFFNNDLGFIEFVNSK